MRFMMLMVLPRDHVSEHGSFPGAEAVARMTRYNQEMVKAGILLAGDGLHPSSTAVRARRVEGRQVVTDGPFSEAREVVGGYWMIQVRTREEAIEWLKKVPDMEDGSVVELRQVFEMSDFPPDVQEAAKM